MIGVVGVVVVFPVPVVSPVPGVEVVPVPWVEVEPEPWVEVEPVPWVEVEPELWVEVEDGGVCEPPVVGMSDALNCPVTPEELGPGGGRPVEDVPASLRPDGVVSRPAVKIVSPAPEG
jgi:hypothetical protein